MKLTPRISALILPSIAVLFSACDVLTGCGASSPSGSSSNTTTTTPTPAPTTAPLANSGASSIFLVGCDTSNVYTVLQFRAAEPNADVTPLRTLPLPSATLVESLATDSSGQVYVGGYSATPSPYNIVVFPTSSSIPSRTIVESDTSVLYHSAMAVDSSGSIYVLGTMVPTSGSAGPIEIAIYSPTASGTSTPARLITGSLTQLANPEDITVDAAGNIYVSDATSILVFPPGANGNVAPSRVITSPNTIFGAMAVDANGNIFTGATISLGSSSILEFAAGATGVSTPIKTITSSALTNAGGLRVDNTGNIYVVDKTINSFSVVTTSTALLEFGPGATGNSTPATNFTSTKWTVGAYNYIATYGGFQVALY
jgi:hypothetical protein